MTGRIWDLRVVWIDRRQRWWWNAWRESTSTELSGFADSRDAAWTAMNTAVSAAMVPPIHLPTDPPSHRATARGERPTR